MLRSITWCAALAGATLLVAAPALARTAADGQGWAVGAVNAAAAWKVSTGSGVTVAVLVADRPDDGVPELRGKVVWAPEAAVGGGVGEAARPGTEGTALASVIAGTGRDGGISGVAPGARILSIPVVEPRPRPDAVDPEAEEETPADTSLARGIRYAADHGASVICLPNGRYGVNRVEREAVSYALSRGVVLVAAAGDGGTSAYARQNGTSYWEFPAGFPGVVGVAAVDRQGRKTATSSDNLSVLVAAPGADVPVARPGGGHGTAAGTGVASAMVAGIAALIKAEYPDIAPELVSRALSSTARPHPRAGYDDMVGFGVVDAAGALEQAGKLLRYGRSAPLRDDAHFGHGPLSGAPARPGPDPVRLGVYGIAVLAGLAGFGAGTVALARR